MSRLLVMLGKNIVSCLVLIANIATSMRLQQRHVINASFEASVNVEEDVDRSSGAESMLPDGPSWQMNIAPKQPVYVLVNMQNYGQNYAQWHLGLAENLPNYESEYPTLSVKVKVFGDIHEYMMSGPTAAHVRPAYDVGTPVYTKYGHGWVTEAPKVQDTIYPTSFSNKEVKVNVEAEIVKCKYMDTKCIWPRTHEGETVPALKLPHRIGAFGYLQCNNEEDLLGIGGEWHTLEPASLRTLVYAFENVEDEENSNQLAAEEKPNCYLQEAIKSNFRQESNVIAPWVGSEDPTGKGGRPYQPFRYTRYLMYGAPVIIDRLSAEMMQKNPGCYEFVRVEKPHVLRWGRWDDEFGASTADTGAIHGNVQYERKIYMATTQGPKCQKFLWNLHAQTKITCTKSAQKAVLSTQPFDGAALGDIPSCRCAYRSKFQWVKKGGSCIGCGLFGGAKSNKVQQEVTCQGPGREHCYEVQTGPKLVDLRVCCCPES